MNLPSFLTAAIRFSDPARVEVLDASTPTSLREADQGAMCVKATGAITDARAVNLSALDGAIYVVENATTGGWPVEFRTSSASGVSLDPGEIALVRCSGATYARVGAVPSRIISEPTGAGMGSPITLDDVDALIVADINSADCRMILPESPGRSDSAGRRITIVAGSGMNTARIETLVGTLPGGSKVDLAAHQSVTVERYAGDKWVVTSTYAAGGAAVVVT